MSIAKCASPLKVSELDVKMASGVMPTGMLQDMSACEDTALDAALEAAGDRADLRAAIKDLYIADKAYVSALTQSPRLRHDAENARESAFEKTRMEIHLAGID